MKLERKHKLRIIIIIAALLILYGILDGIFRFNIDPKIVSQVSTVFMLIAFVLLFSDRRKKADTITKTDDSIEIQDKPKETEADSLTQDTAQIEASNPEQDNQAEKIDEQNTK